MHVAGSRRLAGVLTLVALVGIFVGVTGLDLPMPRLGGSNPADQPLPGVRAVASAMVLKVGAGAPAGGELAFMAVDAGGNLIVTDAARSSVMRFDASGQLLNEWGPRVADIIIDQPAGIATLGDNVYVLDRGTPRIFRLDSSGRLQATLSLHAFGTYGLNGLAVDSSGNLYAADTGRNRILVLSPTGTLLKTIGRAGSDLGGFTQPMMLAFGPDASLFVADWENNRVQRFSSTFEATDAWMTGFRPFGVAVDRLGRVFVPDSDKRRVMAYTAQGALLGEVGVPGSGSPTIGLVPRQVAVARGDRPALYVLGADGIQRLDLENTAPPPQGIAAEVDPTSLLVICALIGVLAFAFLSRRARRASFDAALDGPIRVHTKDGAQRQHEKPRADQELLVANQPKREQ